MKNRIVNMNLRKKLYTLICLLILIPVILAGVVTDAVFISRFQTQERDVALNVLLQARNNIRYVLGEVENISLMLLYDDSIQSLYRALILQKGKVNVAVLRRNVLKSLSSLVFNRPYVNAVLVTSGSEKLFEFGEAVTSEDDALYQAAVEAMGRPVWTEARQLRNTVRVNPQHYVSMLRAISDLNEYGQVIGVCRISFVESVLSNTLSELNAYGDSDATIFDMSGNVVSSTDKALLGQNQARTEALALALQDGRTSGYVQTVENGRSLTHLFFRMNDPNWIVVQTVDDSHFHAQFTALIVLMAGALLFCLIFTAVYSVVIGNTVLKPIKRMYREMDRVRKGDLEIQIPYESEDEIGQLSRQFVRMAHELKALIETKYKQQILLKEAELQNLESQINPHFLYNTLDTIRWIAVKNKDTVVCEQIEALSDLFRHVLNKGEEMTTLGEELLHLENYLLLQKARYGDKISVEMRIDETLLGMPMPKLLIQPLVENAIYHGIEHKVGAGTIRLNVGREDNNLLVTVEDDGVGTQGEEISRKIYDKQDSSLFALHNIHERIQLRYGEAYGERFYSQPGRGTRVELRIPLEQDAAR